MESQCRIVLRIFLVEKENKHRNIKDFILIEFPSLEDIIIKPGLFPQLSSSILLCRANRAWSKVDKNILSSFVKTTGNKPQFILNGVETDFAAEHIGKVPKKGNSFLKKVVKFNSKNQKKIG